MSDRLATIALGVLLFVLAFQVWQGRAQKSALAEATRSLQELGKVADSLQGAAADRALGLLGWSTAFGATSPDSARTLIEAQNAELLAELEARNLKVRAYARANARMAAELEATSTGSDVDESGIPTRWAGELEDGCVRGTWTFRRFDTEGELVAELECQAQLEYFVTDAGRATLLGVRSLTPGFEVELGEYVFPVPEPEIVTEYVGPSFLSRLTHVSVGASLGAFATSLACSK